MTSLIVMIFRAKKLPVGRCFVSTTLPNVPVPIYSTERRVREKFETNFTHVWIISDRCSSVTSRHGLESVLNGKMCQCMVHGRSEFGLQNTTIRAQHNMNTLHKS